MQNKSLKKKRERGSVCIAFLLFCFLYSELVQKNIGRLIMWLGVCSEKSLLFHSKPSSSSFLRERKKRFRERKRIGGKETSDQLFSVCVMKKE